MEAKIETKIFRVTKENTDEIKLAGRVISNGGTVVFPTETVYGLGANALDSEACAKIYAAKGRPSDNPLIIHVADFHISKYVSHVSEKAEVLMESFWPGPLTIILPKSEVIPELVTGGLNSVAVRMPSNKIARMLIEFAGVPIAAPSANISGRPSPTTIEHCIEDLSGRVDMIIGGEKCDVGLESTIVDATSENITILRPGAITKAMLEEVVGKVEVDPACISKMEEGQKPKAPGMKYRHYAPKAKLTIIKGDNDKMVSYINSRVAESKDKGIRVGVMGTEENIGKYNADSIISIGSKNSMGIIAANLFDCLREFDKIEVDQIFSEGFSEDGIGMAIMNRLKKAAGYNIIEV
jgi:L-threonylcarbamoyladenylate synthase